MFVCDGLGKKSESNNSMNRHTQFVCCQPRHRKNFNNYSKWDKGHRVQTNEEKIIFMLEVMREELRKRTVLANAGRGQTSSTTSVGNLLYCYLNMFWGTSFIL